jgi:hypothetical protein
MSYMAHIFGDVWWDEMQKLGALLRICGRDWQFHRPGFELFEQPSPD